jgi:TetR/AcrR family transcriptional regulator, regulator of cefoperazone and chloramphenicol sensitivity
MDHTRQQLIDAAGPLFAEKGFRATTVREICEAARANQAAVNYHFGDKESLYIECVREAGRCCTERVPMPVWPAATAPEAKLRDFIRMFLNRVAVDHQPAWHTQLIMREMLLPTEACAEFVKDYVRPTFDVLRAILREMLPADVSERQQFLLGSSIIGQVLHYRTARPVIALLIGQEVFDALDVDTLTEHITAVSRAALEQFSSRRRAGETP